MFWKCRVLFVRFLLASKDLRCKTQHSTFTVVLSFNLSLHCYFQNYDVQRCQESINWLNQEDQYSPLIITGWVEEIARANNPAFWNKNNYKMYIIYIIIFLFSFFVSIIYFYFFKLFSFIGTLYIIIKFVLTY